MTPERETIERFSQRFKFDESVIMLGAYLRGSVPLFEGYQFWWAKGLEGRGWGVVSASAPGAVAEFKLSDSGTRVMREYAAAREALGWPRWKR